jgi:NitT/TauT family transport system substrate-binding protein
MDKEDKIRKRTTPIKSTRSTRTTATATTIAVIATVIILALTIVVGTSPSRISEAFAQTTNTNNSTTTSVNDSNTTANSPTAGANSNAANTETITTHKTLRVGYFANINHAQAVIGFGRGDFQKILGNNVDVKTQIFNAGPAAIEALFANQIDVAYLGPNPAINGYIKSDGQSLRIISGAASGGAAFVVRSDSGINSVKDLGNKVFAAPELGNTQDVALRKYLLDNGYKTKENGGNVQVLTVQNPDIITLFLKKQIDGAWVPEPWAERLVKEAGGKIFLDEKDRWPQTGGRFVTTNIVASTNYLKNNPDVIKKLLEAHVNETQWINANKPSAIKAFNTELQKLTQKTISEDILNASFARTDFTYDPIRQSLLKDANEAHDLGYLKQIPDLSGIYDLTILQQVLQEKGLPPVSLDQNSTTVTTTSTTAAGINSSSNNTNSNNTQSNNGTNTQVTSDAGE